MKAQVEVALARIMAAAGPPPAKEAMEEDDQRRECSNVREAMEEDDGLDIVGAKEAHEVEQQEAGLADRAGPKTGEVETCRHWAKGWCMRADACHFTHPQPPVPQGVPQELLPILQAIAGVGALRLHRAQHHATLMCEVVERAQGGGLPAVGHAVACGSRTMWAVALLCGMAALLTPFPVVPRRDMVTLQKANLGSVCTWHTHPACIDPHGWQAKAVVTYLSWSLPTAPGTWAQWWDKALSWARDGSAVAACPNLPREPVAAKPWTVSLHLPTVAARLAVVDPEVRPLKDEDAPRLHLGQGMEVRCVRLPSPVARDILEGLQFTRGDGADVWTLVHRQLPDAWQRTLQPPGHERLVGVEWRVWAANRPCRPVVVVPKKSGPHPSLETLAVVWGWVTVRGTGGHVLTAPRGTAIETDGGVAMQLTAENPATHVVVAVLQWGAEGPQPWRDPIARVIWRDMPILRATIWSGGAGQHLPGALPWLRDCGDSSPPPAEMHDTLEDLYANGDKPGPRHHFLVAADPTAELGDDTVALVADVAQCPPRHDAREGAVGGPAALPDSGRPSHCAVRPGGRLGGRVP